MLIRLPNVDVRPGNLKSSHVLASQVAGLPTRLRHQSRHYEAYECRSCIIRDVYFAFRYYVRVQTTFPPLTT